MEDGQFQSKMTKHDGTTCVWLTLPQIFFYVQLSALNEPPIFKLLGQTPDPGGNLAMSKSIEEIQAKMAFNTGGISQADHA